MTDNYIPSSQAIAIFRDIANRPRASRASLSYWVDRGLIRHIKVSKTFWLYEKQDVENVAKRIGGAA